MMEIYRLEIAEENSSYSSFSKVALQGVRLNPERRRTNKSPSSNSIFTRSKIAARRTCEPGHFYFLLGTYVAQSPLLRVICGEYCYALRAFQRKSVVVKRFCFFKCFTNFPYDSPMVSP